MDVDVLVLGAGPAGTSAAIPLAEYGYRVRVVDRARLPRDRIGESLPPKIEGLLGILGVKAAVEQAGFARMRGTVVDRGEDRVHHEFDPEVGRLGYQVRRARFDGLLAARARAVGVEVSEATAAVGLIEEGGRVRGARLRGEGEEAEQRARYVVDATGGASFSSRALGIRRRDAVRTVALCAYWAETRVPDDFEATATLFEMFEDGWIWSLLRQDGLRNVTLGVDAARVKEGAEGSTRALYDAMLARSSLVGPLLESARLAAPLTAHDATWSEVERFAQPGLLFCGDAAAFIDPLTSQGVYKAIQSGIVAAAVVNTALTAPDDEAMALEYYAASQARFAANYAEIARSFYRASPFADRPFWAARIRAGAAGPEELREDVVEARASRREAFRRAVEEQGGLRVEIAAKAGLTVEDVPVATAGRILRRAALRYAGETVDAPRVDVGRLLAVLDGRPMARVFDGYAEAVGEPPSVGLGRRLMVALSNLAAVEAIEVRLSEVVH